MSQALTAPMELECVELREPLRGGRTRPHTALAVDGEGNEHHIVLKLREPGTPRGRGHYGATSLACELVCSMLARLLGLPVPDYSIVNVSSALAEAQVSALRPLLAANLGPNFGCAYHEEYALWHPLDRPNQPGLLDGLESTLEFDATVVNGDRNIEKPNLLVHGEQLLLIDHSLALPCYLWPADVPEPVLLPEANVRRHAVYHALRKRERAFDTILGVWGTKVDSELWDAVSRQVPKEWREDGNLDRIDAFLRARGAHAPVITTDLRRIVR